VRGIGTVSCTCINTSCAAIVVAKDLVGCPAGMTMRARNKICVDQHNCIRMCVHSVNRRAGAGSRGGPATAARARDNPSAHGAHGVVKSRNLSTYVVHSGAWPNVVRFA